MRFCHHRSRQATSVPPKDGRVIFNRGLVSIQDQNPSGNTRPNHDTYLPTTNETVHTACFRYDTGEPMGADTYAIINQRKHLGAAFLTHLCANTPIRAKIPMMTYLAGRTTQRTKSKKTAASFGHYYHEPCGTRLGNLRNLPNTERPAMDKAFCVNTSPARTHFCA